MRSSPPYRTPKTERGLPVPRVVNPRWVMQALRDQARATTRDEFLPWNAEQLLRRAATVIELHVVRSGR